MLALLLLLVSAGAALAQPEACPSSVPYGRNPAAGRVVTLNDIRVYYETYGNGPPLVLIHGNGGSIASMRCQISHFARSYRVIAADGRSQGRTETGTRRFTYEQMAEDLSALLTELKIDSASIIGHSDGGIVGLLLAIHHPLQVTKLVASSPNLQPDSSALFPWVLDGMKKTVGNADAMMAKGDRTRDWANVKRLTELMLNEPHVPMSELRKIQAPTLLIGSDEDMITPEHLLDIYRNIPKAHFFILPGSTHMMTDGLPEIYNAAAERFLSQPFSRPTTRKAFGG